MASAPSSRATAGSSGCSNPVATVYSIRRASSRRRWSRSDRYAVLRAARPDLASSLFEAVENKAGELAVVSYDGRPVHLVGPWMTRVFWKVATKVDVERIDVAVDPKVAPRHLKVAPRHLKMV